MKVDSIIQRIDAVLDGPVCIRPGCCAPALPWLSPWCTPDCQRTHWAATRAEAVTDRPVLGAELAGAWVDEVDWSRFTADASHSPIEDLNALAGEVIYTTSTPDPPGSWFRSLLARWHGR